MPLSDPQQTEQSESSLPGEPAGPKAAYQERLDRYTAERDALTQRWNGVANQRLIAFIAGAGLTGWGVIQAVPLAVAGGIVGLILFVVLAVYHNRLGKRRRQAATLAEINAEGLARVGRVWAELPEPAPLTLPPDHPFAADLDLVGHASLQQLVDTTSTPMGTQTLGDWLVAPATPEVVRERQVAVADLAPRLAWRQELEAQGRLAAGERRDPEPLLAWAEGPRWLASRPWLRVLSWVGPLLLIGLVVAQLTGVIAAPLWVVAFVANLLLSQLLGRPANTIALGVNAHHWALLGYARQIALVSELDASAPLLVRLKHDLSAAGEPAPALLRRLSRISAFPMPLASPLYLPLQAICFWDIHVLAAMERWQAVAGPHVRQWLETLGQVEALAGLAGLAHDNPTWAFPDLDPAADTFDATALGHPLLADSVRVTNDVTVGPPGTFLLVTGSNMSGKSTLLRSIGVNTVLAGAGAPVCAGSLRLPPVSLWTSVRVQDSLERGVSFFMAELQRLKLVVAAARAANASNGPRVLYLLDEMLQGTNTAERQIAARRIIVELVNQGAIGAVSTHDLALADAPELRERARPVHFTDIVGDGVTGPLMSFDYRLRPGVATTTNALRLMQLVGFDIEPGQASPLPTDSRDEPVPSASRLAEPPTG